MDGCQVGTELKADERTCDIPIIFISGLHATADKVRAFEAGGVDYITKPFQSEEIKARIRTHMAVREMQTVLQAQNHRLQQEIEERQRAQEELRRAHDELERRVQERTSDLQQANNQLRTEITEREKVEAKLRQAFHEIEKLKDRLQNENTYLQRTQEQRGHSAILGDSGSTKDLLLQIEQVAKTDATVLIVGKPGQGRDWWPSPFMAGAAEAIGP